MDKKHALDMGHVRCGGTIEYDPKDDVLVCGKCGKRFPKKCYSCDRELKVERAYELTSNEYAVAFMCHECWVAMDG